MPQVGREACSAARCPTTVALGVGALEWTIAVSAVKVQQQVHLRGVLIVEVRCRPFHITLDDGAIPSGSRPRPKETVGGHLHEHVLLAFILHEAEKGVVTHRQNVQIDRVAWRLVDVRLRGAECAKIARVGVSYPDVGWPARVSAIRSWIL